MTDPIRLAEGVFLIGTDLPGMNAFLSTSDALHPGMAVLIMGELEPGKMNVAVVQGEPIGGAIHANADGSLKRAAVVRMTTHYDERHTRFLQIGIMRAFAEARGMTPSDDAAWEVMEAETDVPVGDLPVMEEALQGLVENIDAALGIPVFGAAPQP